MYRFLLAVVVAFQLCAGSALAQSSETNGIIVEDAWARASAGNAKSGAAYFTLANGSGEVDRLMAVQSDLSKRTEIHTHAMSDGVMRMVHVEKGIEVHPGTPTVLQPGGLHIMFMGLKKPLVEGEILPLTLVFEKAGKIDIKFTVRSVGARQGMSHGEMRNTHPQRHNH